MNPAQPLRRSVVLKQLGASRFATDLTRLGLASSTSDLLIARGRDGAPDGAVIVADGQTLGRGRRGTTWVSPPRSGLYFSVLLRPPPAPLNRLSPALGVGIAQALEAFGIQARIKWPNDILINCRKVGGLLVDLTTDLAGDRFAVIGVGLNIESTPEYPRAPDSVPPTSIANTLQITPNREDILVAALKEIEQSLTDLELGHYQKLDAAYAQRDGLIGALVRLRNRKETIEGKVVRILPSQGLELETDTGITLIDAAFAHLEAVRWPAIEE